MLHPRWFSFLPHSFYSALNHCRTPILFSVCEAFCISALHLLLRSLSYFFIFLFKNLLFSPSATIFRIIFLPLGFLLFFSSVRFSLTLPQTPHSCFLLSELRSFMGEAGGRLGVLFFWLWKAMNVPIDSSEILQRRVCTTLSTFTKFATAVNESLTNPSKSEVYLKRCNSFPQITLSGLPEQAFIFILRDPTACSEANAGSEQLPSLYTPGPPDNGSASVPPVVGSSWISTLVRKSHSATKLMAASAQESPGRRSRAQVPCRLACRAAEGSAAPLAAVQCPALSHKLHLRWSPTG